MESGACLLFYTDGVTEARDPSGAFLGLEPVRELATVYVDGPAQVLVDRLYGEIERFAEGHFSDDVSLLALRFP